MEYLQNSVPWKQLSWLCVVFLLLMSSAQAAHICPLTDDYQPQHGSAAQWNAAPSTHAFCAICASSHSPSLAAPFASLVSFKSPSGQFLAGNVVERSASPLFALDIRPPPAR